MNSEKVTILTEENHEKF